MGAATLAFFPIRRALLTEGESDMLLLPTMLRESLDVVSLTFQIVPGLSKTSGINLPILARNGKGVAFALDFDKGGRALEEKIVGAGFDSEAIFYVRGATSSADVQIEDFISPKILAHGCNEAFRKLGSSRPDISSSAFRASGRLDTIARHFEVKRRDVPKTLIAYDILDYMVDHPDEALIDVNKRKAFQQFAQKVSTYLKESAKED
jgi:hypothetical protein